LSKEHKNNFFTVYNEYIIYARKNQKEQSFESLKSRFELRILPYFKDKNLEDITSKDILAWEDSIMALNYSNNYNKSLYYALSGFFEFCKLHYNFNKNIISNVGCFKPKYEKDNHKFYNKKEFDKFIKYVEEPVYKQFFCFMFYVGTRPGETMALKFSDLKNGYISIDKTMNSHGKRNIGTPKTRTSNRIIAIDKVLEKDLLELKKGYEEKYNLKNYDYFIFGGKKQLSPSSISRRSEKAAKMANLRKLTLHQFRHSHATLLIQNGMMINEVSRRLGHSKTSTTLDIYSHTDLMQEKRVLNALNHLRLNPYDRIKSKFIEILNFISSKF